VAKKYYALVDQACDEERGLSMHPPAIDSLHCLPAPSAIHAPGFRFGRFGISWKHTAISVPGASSSVFLER
jgi:hypothetical protein